MPQIIELTMIPAQAEDQQAIMDAIRKELGPEWSGSFIVLRRSVDSRKRQVKVVLRLAAYGKDEVVPPAFSERKFNTVHDHSGVVIVGAGPAGLFAALKLLELGVRPVVLERGKDVQSRRRDLVKIHREHTVNPDSNYCFGEGGAGTYSDGKLYTRSTKRGDVRAILETLVQFGADERILSDAHPHIGTNKLPGIISSMRKRILECGGEIHFNTRLEGITLNKDSSGKNAVEKIRVKHLDSGTSDEISTSRLILATGHSARDIFLLLHDMGIPIEFKPFALGVRVEHPQRLIDSIQYHCADRGEYLPPAAYALAEQVDGKGVYSFCMCPGGIIAPCATENDEVVTNGWSPSRRNNPYANSGIVVPVSWDDLPEYHKYGALAGMYFQQSVEQKCRAVAGNTQAVPAQRMTDFVEGRLSKTLPECSYQPGVSSQRLDQVLPPFISRSLREGFRLFAKKMNGYYTPEAIVVGPESRTSSPVRIPRDTTTYQHPDVHGLFPCGEGAGYAGGIVSAAMDGELAAAAVASQCRQSAEL